MPLGFERINERTQRPNALINFIRTIPGPSSTTAEQILSRVAAVCYPFMKSNMILVQALEEFPYNTEFVGRNFNAGEIIQLVLRDRNGRWLPQRMVEMVMVHELAHCKQMNHSKAFWTVRDAYAIDLRALWAKRYTGEGLWGRGRGLATGSIQTSQVDVGDIPEHLCGGTYGRRSKKRKRGGKEKATLSYAERKQRRTLKKFGAGGHSLGADNDIKIELEGGVQKKGKPRVAASARGRELRAAAALARFEPVKKEPAAVIVKTEEIPDSETEDEYQSDQADAALDVDGTKLVDDKGCPLIKMCEDEDEEDDNTRREMDELKGFAPHQKPAVCNPVTKAPTPCSITKRKDSKPVHIPPKATSSLSAQVVHLDDVWKRPSGLPEAPASKTTDTKPTVASVPCIVCSLSNDPGSLTCSACSNVLSPHLVPDHWRCNRGPCKQSIYINAGDSGSCGVCAKVRWAQ